MNLNIKESPIPMEDPEKVDILIVDDLPQKMLAMEAVLSELNENLVKATSGREALRLLLRQEFAVILLDVNMPGIDGFETASLIRQRKNTENTPIIFITAVGDSELQKAKGYSLGAVDYIFSPIIPEILKTKVRVFVDLYKKTLQIKRMNAELEQRIYERTKQLEKANGELRRLSKIKTDFTSMVSHELRTPLSSIKQGIDIVLDGIDGPIVPEQAETLQIAKNNVDRLARLIDNVLDYNRLESGKLELSFEQTDMGALVNETCRLMRMAADKKGVAVLAHISSPGTFIFCDADKIQQVLINMVHNAIKFTEPEGTITVSLEQEEETIRIAVEDTGIGIPPEDQKMIFDKFRQSSDFKQRAGGVGLGLAIGKKYMELHSGKIQVESKVGKGSKFTLILPQKQSQNYEQPHTDYR